MWNVWRRRHTQVLVRKPEQKTPLALPRFRWNVDAKTDLQETGRLGLD